MEKNIPIITTTFRKGALRCVHHHRQGPQGPNCSRRGGCRRGLRRTGGGRRLLGGRGAAASAAVSPKGVRTNEDRIAYLESYGWSVSSDPIAVEELIIPEQFDETYSQYLELQASQGFDLTDYCGKRVKRYTYEITNYPTGESGHPGRPARLQEHGHRRRCALRPARGLHPRAGDARLNAKRPRFRAAFFRIQYRRLLQAR